MLKNSTVTNCESTFLVNALKDGKRCDGRRLNEFRKPHITFGKEYGCCYVSLGKTKVLANVSCELTTPRLTREAEGTLQVNVELSTMAHPDFDSGPAKITDVSVEVTRTLERVIRDSQCIDMESLCVVTAEKVWGLTIDVHVLNYDGNVVDCSSMAAIAALSHFKRPDVTVSGSDIKIWPFSEREPLPLTVVHLPCCVTVASCPDNVSIVDPTELEESVVQGKIVCGLNILGEVCALQASGGFLVSPTELIQCVKMAAKHVNFLTDTIKAALAKDKEERDSSELLQDDIGFGRLMTLEDEVCSFETDDKGTEEDVLLEENGHHSRTSEPDISPQPEREVHKAEYPHTCQVGLGGDNTWVVDVTDSSDDDGDSDKDGSGGDDDVVIIDNPTPPPPPPPARQHPAPTVDIMQGDSDEEVVILDSKMKSQNPLPPSKKAQGRKLDLTQALKKKGRRLK